MHSYKAEIGVEASELPRGQRGYYVFFKAK
jgi:hypothetical protein